MAVPFIMNKDLLREYPSIGHNSDQILYVETRKKFVHIHLGRINVSEQAILFFYKT